jgi:nitrate reductase gamma subunit
MRIRVLAYLGAVMAVALAIYAYFAFVYGLGFPDGFITELGYAQRRLAYVLIGISVVLGAYFIYLSALTPQKKMAQKLFAVILLYLIAIVAVASVDYYFRLHLTGSGGG